MFSFLGFGKGKIKEAIRQGAVIIDVRTPQEFDRGKIPGSLNIPLDKVSATVEKIKSLKKPVVLCCASGMRSGSAKKILQSRGITEVFNGGSWESVLKLINQP